jgi:class 3 adenylate cyclase
MTRESINLAVLFADIARSTHLYEVLGDTTAKNLISDCISMLSQIVKQFHGSVIKTIGDELLCTFPDANNAINAGISMHETIENLLFIDNPDYTSPNIYVGIHYGPVIKEDDDIFGDTVNLAARMVAIAKQRQIIITEQTVEQLNSTLVQSTKYIDKIPVKGKSGVINIFEVVWEKHELTVMFKTVSSTLFSKKIMPANLILQYHDNIITVNQNRPVVTIGRQIHNDIVVTDSPVSRSHARVEYRRNTVLLIDQSSNGTYIHEHGKKMIHVKQFEMPLTGNGIISLGRKPDSNMSYAIHYNNKNQPPSPDAVA